MGSYVLGLDLGSNSIGWMILDPSGQTLPGGKMIAGGVRIFPEGVDRPKGGAEQPRGQQRRVARGMRRMIARRRQRKLKTLLILQSAGWLPKQSEPLHQALAADPYLLREKGLSERLTAAELGRALYHFAQRRGFKSNRKSEKKSDDGKVAKATAQLQQDMEQAGCQTLGQYLAHLRRRHNPLNLESPRIRNRYTLRSMYLDEFGQLWKAQTECGFAGLTDSLRNALHDAIFFQRPLKVRPELVGDCELEIGHKRAPKAHYRAQEYRIWQDVNTLRVVEPTGEERRLNDDERRVLAEELSAKKELTFDKARQLLRLLDTQEFNLEYASQRKKLQGNSVGYALSKKPLNKWYESLDAAARRQVQDAIVEMEDDELRTAAGQWGLDEKQIEALMAIDLPSGYGSLSLAAIDKLLPILQGPGGLSTTEAKQAAGYSLVPQMGIVDTLPPLNDVAPVTNPLVRRALGEVRKVVNLLVSVYGKPGHIVVEMAREMKLSRDKRAEVAKENFRRRDENETIRKKLVEEFNLANPSRDDVLKYRLWQECACTCVYTGRTIPPSLLFSGEIQIEHILPYSRCLDDSFMNKSLCWADENRLKHNQTPFEAYGSRPEVYEQLLQRVRSLSLPWPKRRRFSQKELVLDDFIQRQLNDTRYISRQAVDYLKRLGCPVRVGRGDLTAELRRQWGLNDLLGGDGDVKTREDHRHHAVDAAVIAATTPAFLQRLAAAKYDPARAQFPAPLENFRDCVKAAVEEIVVSHRPNRKLAGPLHEETALGPTSDPKVFVHRVPVSRLTAAQIEFIRDGAIQKIIRNYVSDHGIESLKKDTVTMPSGVPIRRVRIATVEKTAIPLRQTNGRPDKYAVPGGNHHVEIYDTLNEKGQPVWTGQAVSRFEAHRRLREGLSPVDRDGVPQREFIMSLCINDTVFLTNPKTGKRGLYRVQKTSISSPLLVMRLHTATRCDDKDPAIKQTCLLVATWNSFRAMQPEKVTVDPVGRVFPAND